MAANGIVRTKRRCNVFRRNVMVCVAFGALVCAASGPAIGGERERLRSELRALVGEADEAFLLAEIPRVQPWHNIRHLARFQQMQDRVGGGFCGCLPGQIANVEEIPLPVDEIGVLQTAIFLAEQRNMTRGELTRLGIPSDFPSFKPPELPAMKEFPQMTLHIDLSVPNAFLEALADGEITMGEAREIVRMPANRELLRFVWSRCDRPKPCVTDSTLTYLIWKAGSSDPLERLWRWMNPMNDFGYADLAVNANEYRRLIDDVQMHRQEIACAALARVGSFFPTNRKTEATYAFLPGCFTGDWETLEMAGANMPRIRTGWEEILRRISAGLIRGELLRRCRGPGGDHPRVVDDLIHAGLDDERFELFFDVIAYTVVEGAVEYMSNPSSSVQELAGVSAGADLIDDYVGEVIRRQQLESAHIIFEHGRGPGGALIALGIHLTRIIAERDGPHAVLPLLEQGPVAFFQRAVEIGAESGGDLVDDESVSAVRDLSARLVRSSKS